MQKYKKHRPFHLYDKRIYFLTARIPRSSNVLLDNIKKKIFQQVLKNISDSLETKIFAWIILHNHYHLLVDFGSGIIGSLDRELTFATPLDKRKTLLSRFVRKLHSCTAKEFNKLDQTPGRQVWYQYWDYCIHNKLDFWKHFNYIIQNPLKHGLVKNLREACIYKYSSNPIWLNRFKEEGLSEGFIKYPVKDWTPSEVKF